MTNEAIIADIVLRDANPPVIPQLYQIWLASLNERELDDHYQAVKVAHPATMGVSSRA